MSLAFILTALALTTGFIEPAQRERSQAGLFVVKSTFSEYWRHANLVIECRVGGSRTRLIGQGNSPPGLTEWDVEVIKVFKQTSRDPVAGRLWVASSTESYGTADRTWKVRDVQPPVLYEGDHVIVFLQEWPAAKVPVIMSGAAGVYEVDGPRVHVPALVRGLSPFNGRASLSLDEFVKLLGRQPK